MLNRAFRCILILASSAPSLSGIDLPAPVDVAVPLVTQKTEEWCWLAVAQMAMRYRNGRAPEQCEMVPVGRPAERQVCCKSPFRCARTGTLEDVQRLLLETGHLKSVILGPINFGELYNSIRQGNPVIIAYESSQKKFHAVVARGMKFYGTGDRITPMVLVNDPMASEPLWVPFKKLQDTWTALLIVGKPDKDEPAASTIQ
jgi:hypothetical protein